MGKPDDKIAIVTGAGQGIGKAIAEKQPADVANVVAFLASDEASFVTRSDRQRQLWSHDELSWRGSP